MRGELVLPCVVVGANVNGGVVVAELVTSDVLCTVRVDVNCTVIVDLGFGFVVEGSDGAALLLRSVDVPAGAGVVLAGVEDGSSGMMTRLEAGMSEAAALLARVVNTIGVIVMPEEVGRKAVAELSAGWLLMPLFPVERVEEASLDAALEIARSGMMLKLSCASEDEVRVLLVDRGPEEEIRAVDCVVISGNGEDGAGDLVRLANEVYIGET